MKRTTNGYRSTVAALYAKLHKPIAGSVRVAKRRSEGMLNDIASEISLSTAMYFSGVSSFNDFFATQISYKMGSPSIYEWGEADVRLIAI